MKKITVTMIALCIALVSGATLAKSSRVTILHKPDTAAEREITISESALPAHCRHGDEVVDGSDFSCGNDDPGILICHSEDGSSLDEIYVTEDELQEHQIDSHVAVIGSCENFA